jgi:hypothetical protein
MKKKGVKKKLESYKKSTIEAKAKKRGIKITKKDGSKKTKDRLIKDLRK